MSTETRSGRGYTFDACPSCIRRYGATLTKAGALNEELTFGLLSGEVLVTHGRTAVHGDWLSLWPVDRSALPVPLASCPEGIEVHLSQVAWLTHRPKLRALGELPEPVPLPESRRVPEQDLARDDDKFLPPDPPKPALIDFKQVMEVFLAMAVRKLSYDEISGQHPGLTNMQLKDLALLGEHHFKEHAAVFERWAKQDGWEGNIGVVMDDPLAGLSFSERVRAGIKQRIRNGQPVGRPKKQWDVTVEQISAAREQGVSWRQMEKNFSIPAVTLRNIYSQAQASQS